MLIQPSQRGESEEEEKYDIQSVSVSNLSESVTEQLSILPNMNLHRQDDNSTSSMSAPAPALTRHDSMLYRRTHPGPRSANAFRAWKALGSMHGMFQACSKRRLQRGLLTIPYHTVGKFRFRTSFILTPRSKLVLFCSGII